MKRYHVRSSFNFGSARPFNPGGKVMRCIILYGVLLVVSSISFASNNPTIYTYASGEHAAAGDKVKLQFTADKPGQTGHVFSLPNGFHLTYGQLVTLGDFYGVVNQPISSGTLDSYR